jgi:hypothetical protein
MMPPVVDKVLLALYKLALISISICLPQDALLELQPVPSMQQLCHCDVYVGICRQQCFSITRSRFSAELAHHTATHVHVIALAVLLLYYSVLTALS